MTLIFFSLPAWFIPLYFITAISKRGVDLSRVPRLLAFASDCCNISSYARCIPPISLQLPWLQHSCTMQSFVPSSQCKFVSFPLYVSIDWILTRYHIVPISVHSFRLCSMFISRFWHMWMKASALCWHVTLPTGKCGMLVLPAATNSEMNHHSSSLILQAPMVITAWKDGILQTCLVLIHESRAPTTGLTSMMLIVSRTR